MKEKILYFGNKLSLKGKTPTGVEYLGTELNIYFQLVTASDKKNIFARLFHMIFVFYKNRSEVKSILIDTYSSWGFVFALIISQLARLNKIPYFPILRGGNLPKRIISSKFLSDLIFKHARINVAPSNYLKVEFEKYNYECVLIPNFIDISQYLFTKREKFYPKLLWVRSFHSIYNPALAIDILSCLLKKYSESSLCMVGPDKDGSMRKCMELAKELNLLNRISFTGYLSKIDWINLSKGYDLFINTTDFDNTPISVLEAMALGLPIISTNVGGIPNLIEDGVDGFLVPPNDTEAFILKIDHIINSPGIGKLFAEKARKKAEAFDVNPIINRWKKLLS